MRLLTEFFGSYAIGQYMKKHNLHNELNIIKINGLDINQMADIIRLGCPSMDKNDEEAPYKKIDDYLRNDADHTLLSLYKQLFTEYDHDRNILKMVGTTVDEAFSGLENIDFENVKNTSLIARTDGIDSDNDINTDTVLTVENEAEELDNNPAGKVVRILAK